MSYYVYITTNPRKTVLYTGVTNNLEGRLLEHYENRGNQKTFAGRYYCYNLLFYECFSTAIEAIQNEKVIKGKSRKWKEELISGFNPNWNFLNKRISGYWPPVK